VAPDARTAENSAVARIEPPRPRGLDSLVATAVWTGAEAGSYQRSGVTGGVSSHERAQSERGSGAGV
jgi:hypothetical protein